MKRYPDWPGRLDAAVRDRISVPFEYGSHDCCLAAADIIEAITGVDPMVAFRGRYQSAASALSLLKAEGKGTLLKTLISLMPQFGAKRIPVLMASVGDLMVTKEARHDACRGQACGICMGQTSIYPGEFGWISLRTKDACAAFKVGGNYG